MNFEIKFILKSGFTIVNNGPFDKFENKKDLSEYIASELDGEGFFYMNGDEACINIKCNEVASFVIR